MFDDVCAQIAWDGEPAEAAAALLADRISISFNSPVYIPQGEFVRLGVQWLSGRAGGAIQALANSNGSNPGITWAVNSSLFSGNGHIALEFDPASYDWQWASGVVVSVHIGTDISSTPGRSGCRPAWQWAKQR